MRFNNLSYRATCSETINRNEIYLKEYTLLECQYISEKHVKLIFLKLLAITGNLRHGLNTDFRYQFIHSTISLLVLAILYNLVLKIPDNLRFDYLIFQ